MDAFLLDVAERFTSWPGESIESILQTCSAVTPRRGSSSGHTSPTPPPQSDKCAAATPVMVETRQDRSSVRTNTSSASPRARARTEVQSRIDAVRALWSGLMQRYGEAALPEFLADDEAEAIIASHQLIQSLYHTHRRTRPRRVRVREEKIYEAVLHALQPMLEGVLPECRRTRSDKDGADAIVHTYTAQRQAICCSSRYLRWYFPVARSLLTAAVQYMNHVALARRTRYHRAACSAPAQSSPLRTLRVALALWRRFLYNSASLQRLLEPLYRVHVEPVVKALNYHFRPDQPTARPNEPQHFFAFLADCFAQVYAKSLECSWMNVACDETVTKTTTTRSEAAEAEPSSLCTTNDSHKDCRGACMTRRQQQQRQHRRRVLRKLYAVHDYASESTTTTTTEDAVDAVRQFTHMALSLLAVPIWQACYDWFPNSPRVQVASVSSSSACFVVLMINSFADMLAQTGDQVDASARRVWCAAVLFPAPVRVFGRAIAAEAQRALRNGASVLWRRDFLESSGADTNAKYDREAGVWGGCDYSSMSETAGYGAESATWATTRSLQRFAERKQGSSQARNTEGCASATPTVTTSILNQPQRSVRNFIRCLEASVRRLSTTVIPSNPYLVTSIWRTAMEPALMYARRCLITDDLLSAMRNVDVTYGLLDQAHDTDEADMCDDEMATEERAASHRDRVWGVLSAASAVTRYRVRQANDAAHRHRHDGASAVNEYVSLCTLHTMMEVALSLHLVAVAAEDWLSVLTDCYTSSFQLEQDTSRLADARRAACSLSWCDSDEWSSSDSSDSKCCSRCSDDSDEFLPRSSEEDGWEEESIELDAEHSHRPITSEAINELMRARDRLTRRCVVYLQQRVRLLCTNSDSAGDTAHMRVRAMEGLVLHMESQPEWPSRAMLRDCVGTAFVEYADNEARAELAASTAGLALPYLSQLLRETIV